VGPRDAVDELLQEEPCDDRSRVATDVLQVRDAALQVIAVLAHERELPERLAGRAAGGDELVDEPLVVPHDAREEMAERDPAGAGEGRDVDDRVGLRARRERERVGEHEPALRIGVQNLHRAPVEVADDVSRLLGAATG